MSAPDEKDQRAAQFLQLLLANALDGKFIR